MGEWDVAKKTTTIDSMIHSMQKVNSSTATAYQWCFMSSISYVLQSMKRCGFNTNHNFVTIAPHKQEKGRRPFHYMTNLVISRQPIFLSPKSERRTMTNLFICDFRRRVLRFQHEFLVGLLV